MQKDEFERKVQEVMDHKYCRNKIKKFGRVKLRRWAIFCIATGMSVEDAAQRAYNVEDELYEIVVDELMDDYQLKQLRLQNPSVPE